MKPGKLEIERLALNQSIAHWERLLEIAKKEKGKVLGIDSGEWMFGKSVFDISPGECALCEVYGDTLCKKCPVFKKTGYGLCYSTPYITLTDALEEELHLHSSKVTKTSKVTKKIVEIVEAELDFLKSLVKPKKRVVQTKHYGIRRKKP